MFPVHSDKPNFARRDFMLVLAVTVVEFAFYYASKMM